MPLSTGNMHNVSFFLKLLDSNTTNFVKDIFIIPTEDIHKNQHLDTKSSSDFEKQFLNINPKYNLDELLKSYKAKYT